MPRMSKKRRLEWSFFLRQVKVGNSTCDRITYNDLCRGCTHSCKQSFRAVIILCPRYYSKRRKKEDRDNGRYDSTVYPPLENVPRRFSISHRNRWMVESADVVVAYVLHDWGGAATTLRCAKQKKKQIISYRDEMGS